MLPQNVLFFTQIALHPKQFQRMLKIECTQILQRGDLMAISVLAMYFQFLKKSYFMTGIDRKKI